MEIKTKISVFKIDLSFLTYAITLSNKPKESNKILTWFAMAAHVVLLTLEILVIMWMGFAMNY
jgi:hypothetical protein